MKQPIFKNIIITGASSGIGAALARECAQESVVLGLMGRHTERLEEVAKACREQGAQVLLGAVDVANEEAMAEWVRRFDDAHPVDLLIANAGISGGTDEGPESLEQMKTLFDVNVEGVWHSVIPMMERMRTRGKGQIGVVASLAGYRGFPGAPAYCASKAAMISWGEAMRGYVREDGIGLSVICPGFVNTPMTEINTYHMPFMISAEKAAISTLRGLRRNVARISFPWPAAFLMWLMRTLPPGMTDFLFARLPAKSSGGMTRR